jgi:glycogen operon protein
MTEEDWTNPDIRSVGLRLAGDAIEEVDERGKRITGETLLMLLNADAGAVAFVLPAHRRHLRWKLLLDTRQPTGKDPGRLIRGGDGFEMESRSLALFQLRSSEEPNGEPPAAAAERKPKQR